MTYADKLKDPRWIQFRAAVLRERGRVCEECEDSGKFASVQVHHDHYEPDREPWDYPIEAVRVLCWRCHADYHEWADREKRRTGVSQL